MPDATATPNKSPASTAHGSGAATRRAFTRAEFDRAYDDLILNNDLVEDRDYYRTYRGRYRRTLEYLAALDLPRPAKILEVGGGQIALLAQHLFGDQGTTGDVNEKFAAAVTKHGIEFTVCDLVHDDIPHRDHFDLVVLCEVIEHMPVPPYVVLEKISRWIRPGGYLLMTTPNLYRLRNVLRLATGMKVFSPWFYPERGKSLGHVTEYAADHLKWQVERAGFAVEKMDLVQLTYAGTHWWAKVLRFFLAGLLVVRPLWRDGLVCVARRRSDHQPIPSSRPADTPGRHGRLDVAS